MNLKQKLILIIVIICSLIAIAIVNTWSGFRSESDGLRIYAQALELYKAQDYHKAYNEFSRVSSKSVLKPAAIYRQARCAEYMHSPKLVMKHYKKLINKYPDFTLSIRIKYLLAQSIYEQSPKKSKKTF